MNFVPALGRIFAGLAACLSTVFAVFMLLLLVACAAKPPRQLSWRNISLLPGGGLIGRNIVLAHGYKK